MTSINEISTENVRVSMAAEGVAVLRLDRLPKRNAFSQAMIDGICAALAALDKRDDVRVLIVAGGSEGPFCAGVDLQELVNISTAEAHKRQFLRDLTDAFAAFSKPTIAAVVGFALGGGFEIVLACDMIYAADDAPLGFPEIKIGTIPGAGGTQRLTRVLGKYKATEFILTGEPASGAEFERLGVVSKVFPAAQVFDKALELAGKIASFSSPVAVTAKRGILAAENTHLDAGMTYEKALYWATFSMEDRQEGMRAFLEKRKPTWSHS